MRIIGLCGLARSGKDTVGQRLVECYGYTRMALADPVREAALALDPMVALTKGVQRWSLSARAAPLSVVVDRWGWEEAKKLPDVRRILQRLGTEVGRQLLSPHGRSVWLDIAEVRMDGFERVVITDVRFDDEASFIRDLNGVVMRVTRPNAGIGDANATHSSEAGIDRSLIDMAVHNTGTLQDLYGEVDKVMGSLLMCKEPGHGHHPT